MSDGPLTATGLARKLGWTPARVTGRLYKARLSYSETGSWPGDFIPEPVNEPATRVADVHEDPVWDDTSETVTAFIAAHSVAGVDTRRWWGAPEFASAIGVDDPGEVRKLLYDARRRTAAAGGVRPVDAMPEPDQAAVGRRGALWNPHRLDVRAYVAVVKRRRGGLLAVAPRLGDVDWLRGQYVLPPAGAGRSVKNLAEELGVSRKVVRDAVEAALEGTGHTLRTRAEHPSGVRTRSPRVASATGPTARQEALASRRLGDRQEQAETARLVLDSGMRLSPLQRRVLQGRVDHPELTTQALAAELGISRGSLSATWTKVSKVWDARRAKQ